MKWPQTTCTVVRVFPRVACVGGWWVVFWVVGGAAVETLFIKISGFFIGVSLWCLCRMTGTEWNLRCRIRGKYGTKLEAQRTSLVLFPTVCWKLGYIYVCLFLILAQAKSVMQTERKTFVLTVLRWNIMTLPYKMRLACEKQMAFVSCLAPRAHELLELLMFFLSPDPDPLHQLCSAMTLGVVHLAFYERTCFSFFFFFFFCIRFSRRLLKDKPRLRRGRMTDEHFLSASPLLKTTRAVFGKKRILSKTGRRSQNFAFGKKKKGSCRASIGLMASLKDFSFCAPDFIPSSRLFTCQRNRVLRCRPGCTCKMFPIGFLLFVPVFVPLLLCRDDFRPRRGPEGRWGDRTWLLETCFFFCPSERNSESQLLNLLAKDRW